MDLLKVDSGYLLKSQAGDKSYGRQERLCRTAKRAGKRKLPQIPLRRPTATSAEEWNHSDQAKLPLCVNADFIGQVALTTSNQSPFHHKLRRYLRYDDAGKQLHHCLGQGRNLDAYGSRGLMSAICRIYERTNGGMKLIAQIRDGKVTGRKAASIREVLKQCGFPNTPIEAAIDYLLMTMPGLGIAYIPARERP